jgi:hypothetical protein
LSRDPIEEAGGANLAGFLGNDGINKVDGLGLVEYPPGATLYRDTNRTQGFMYFEPEFKREGCKMIVTIPVLEKMQSKMGGFSNCTIVPVGQLCPK